MVFQILTVFGRRHQPGSKGKRRSHVFKLPTERYTTEGGERVLRESVEHFRVERTNRETRYLRITIHDRLVTLGGGAELLAG